MELRLVVKRIDGENITLENQSDRKDYIVPAALLPVVHINDTVTLFSMATKGNHFYKTEKEKDFRDKPW